VGCLIINSESAYFIMNNQVSLDVVIGIIMAKNMKGPKGVKGFQFFENSGEYVSKFHTRWEGLLPDMIDNEFWIPKDWDRCQALTPC